MRFRIRNAVFGAIGYLYLFVVFFAMEVAAGVVALVYVAICVFLTRQIIASAEARRSGKVIEFAQSGAANALGSEWGSFHHVFCSDDAVTEAFRDALNNALKGQLGCADLQEIVFKDVDRDLRAPETRSFLHTHVAETARNTGFTLLCTFTRTANVQGVRWWILLKGIKDPNKIFWRYALSPLTVPFVLLPYIRRHYDPLNGLMTVYPGFFNGIDVLNRARELQFVAFETLIEVLNSFGIDTSDLKQQRGNILNINVSGGQTSFGSVVQGAMNRVQGAVGGAN